jgi:hypothetical protein
MARNNGLAGNAALDSEKAKFILKKAQIHSQRFLVTEDNNATLFPSISPTLTPTEYDS